MAITEFPINTTTFEELDVITDAQATDADGVMFFDQSVGVMKRMTRGELFKNKVIPIDSIAEFPSLDTDSYSNRQQFNLGSFAPDGEDGGGIMLWEPDQPKSLHDGINYFSPTVPIPADFDSPTDVQNYRDGVGEEWPSGDGIFVLNYFVSRSEFEAAISDISALDDRVTEAEADIVSLENRVSETETDISSLDVRVTTAESDIVVLENRVTDTVTTLSALPLLIGSKVSTKGCLAIGDGGQGDFIVEAASGTPDGFSRVLIANGNHAVLQQPFNAQQFGILADGSDSTARISVLSAWLWASGQRRVIHFPRGEYLFDLTGINFPMTAHFTGDGREASVIQIVNAGFVFNTVGGDDYRATPGFSHCTIIPIGSNIDRAVYVVGDPTQGGTTPIGTAIKPAMLMESVMFRGRWQNMPGHPEQPGYPSSGAGARQFIDDYVTNAYICASEIDTGLINNVYIIGGYNVGSGTSYSDAVGIRTENSSVDFQITNTHVRSCAAFSSFDGDVEGFHINNCTSIYCRDGIYSDLSGEANRPGGFIDNFYAAVSRWGVYMNNHKDFQIGTVQLLRSPFFDDETEYATIKLVDCQKAHINYSECRPAVTGFTGVLYNVYLDTCENVGIDHLIGENLTDVIRMDDCDGVSLGAMHAVNCGNAYRADATCDNIFMPRNITGSLTTIEQVSSGAFVNRGTALGWGTTNSTQTVTAAGSDTSSIKDSNYKRIRIQNTGYTYLIQPSTTGARRGDIKRYFVWVDSTTITLNVADSAGNLYNGAAIPIPGANTKYSIDYIFNGSAFIVDHISVTL